MFSMFFNSGMLVWLSCVLFVCCMHRFIYDIKIWKLSFYIFIARETDGQSCPLEDTKLIKEDGYVNSINWNTLLTSYTLQKKIIQTNDMHIINNSEIFVYFVQIQMWEFYSTTQKECGFLNH